MNNFPSTQMRPLSNVFRGLPPWCRIFLLAPLFGLPAFALAQRQQAANHDHGVPATDINPEHIPVTGPTRIQAENVSFQVTGDVRVSVRSLDGLMTPAHANRPISLDDPASMRIQVLSAETSLTAQSLTNLLNEYTLPHARTSIHDLTISFEDGEVRVTGKVKKMLEIPFSAEGSIDVTQDGNVRLHFTKITAAGFMHKKLLDLLGLDIADVATPGRNHSFQVIDDDVIFPIHTLFPPPHFFGRLRSAKIEGDALVQVFGTPHAFPPAPVPAERYIYFRGGRMQAGRLTMQGVDLELLNKEERQPFTFSIEHSFAEALPGYLKNLPNRGIVAYISSYPDTIAPAK